MMQVAARRVSMVSSTVMSSRRRPHIVCASVTMKHPTTTTAGGTSTIIRFFRAPPTFPGVPWWPSSAQVIAAPAYEEEDVGVGSGDAPSRSFSSKAALRDVPSHQYRPVLRHIENIGVGMRPKRHPKHLAKLKKKKNGNNSPRRKDHNDDQRRALSRTEEDDYFAGVSSRRRAGDRRVLRPVPQPVRLRHPQTREHGRGSSSSSSSSRTERTDRDPTQDGCWWMPPPPFAVSSDIYDERTKSGMRVKRLPVKVVGRSTTTTTILTSTDNDDPPPLEEREYDNYYDDHDPATLDTPPPPSHTRIAFPRSSKSLPEVAIAGRSNVGKSTLLNALLYGNQMRTLPERYHSRKRGTPDAIKMPKGIKAAMSARPGETKDITFYQLTSEVVSSDAATVRTKTTTSTTTSTKTPKISLALADLPGYGFAYASPERAEQWRHLMKTYILHRGKSLKRVLLLLDARHGFKQADFEFLSRLQEDLRTAGRVGSDDTSRHFEHSNNSDIIIDGIRRDQKQSNSSHHSPRRRRDLPPIQLVLTKCDLVSQIDLARRVVQVREELSDLLIREPSSLPVMLVSAKAGLGFNNFNQGGRQAKGGILELQRELAALVPEPKIHDD